MEQDIIHTAEVLSPDNIFQQERAQYDIAVSTAKKYPRNLSRFVENAIVTVTLDQDTAQSCNYALPRGGKTLQGPSIHLAKIIAQLYGNFRADVKVIGVDQTHVTSRAVAYDLESNFAISIEVKRSILQNEWRNGVRTGRMVRMNDDMITVTGNAANSIALRNAIFAVIPQAYINKINNAAKGLVVGDISDETKFLKRRNEIFKKLKDNLGVTDDEILFSIGKASIANVTPDDLVAIIGFGQSIKDGDATVDSVFRNQKGSKNSDEKAIIKEKQLNTLYTAKNDLIPEADKENIKRIIENKEVSSYDKTIKFLKTLTKNK